MGIRFLDGGCLVNTVPRAKTKYFAELHQAEALQGPVCMMFTIRVVKTGVMKTPTALASSKCLSAP